MVSEKQSTQRMLSLQTLRRFEKQFRGELILPAHRGYSRARRVWNHAVNRYPQIIVRCITSDDVIRAIELAHSHKLTTAVRAGGHSFAGHGVCDSGIVIDLSLMKQASIDPGMKLIRIGPGVLGNELDCMTQAFKMAVPLGSCPSTGVIGYTLGGGVSSLTPKFGYACDNMVQCELITADGRKVLA